VFSASDDPKALVRSWQTLKAWFKIGYTPVWPGVHQFGYYWNYETEFKNFVDTIVVLSKLLPSTYTVTRFSIIQKAVANMTEFPSNAHTPRCWICLENFPNVLLPCKHVFCTSCMATLQNIADDQAPFSFHDHLFRNVDKSIPALAFMNEENMPPLHRNACPICSKVFHKTAVNHPPRGFLIDKIYTFINDNQQAKQIIEKSIEIKDFYSTKISPPVPNRNNN
jgi:hypothetical protein